MFRIRILLALIFVPPHAFAFEFLTSNSNPVSWNSTPIEYSFAPKTPREMKLAAIGVLSEYEQASHGKLKFKLVKYEWNTYQIAFVYSRLFQDFPSPAVTRPIYGDRFISAMIIVNGQSYKWHRGAPAADRPNFDCSYDAILLHEVGHALGLGHSENPDAAMYARLHSFLNSDDIAGLLAMYGTP